MRLRTTISVTIVAGLFAAVSFVAACSKEEDKEEEETKTSMEADATQASAAATANMLSKTSSASLRDPNFRANLRAMYQEANARARLFKAMQDDQPTMDLDICALLAQSCPSQIGVRTDDASDGTSCETTSCEGGQAMTCTSPAQTAVCKDVTYTFAESQSKSLMGCTNGTDGTSTLSIDLDFSGALSGGSITTPINLVCKIAISMPFSINSTDDSSSTEEEAELSCEDGQFSCTIDGEPLSCADMKAAVESNSCD